MKKKMIYRIWSVVFALMLIISTLSGCGDNSNHTGNSEIESEMDSNQDSENSGESESDIGEDTNQSTDTESEIESETETETEGETESETESGTGNDTGNGTGDGSGGETGSGSGNENESGDVDTEEDSEVEFPTSDPYVGMTKAEFYANYKPATCLADALYRSQHGFLSGSLEVPGQYAQDADYRPMENGLYIRNTDSFYADDGNTYIVVDSNGKEVMRIYKGGAYITLEEVAAYMYAFGGSKENIPANYTSSKKTKPANSMWGEYLRVNHSYFTGSTTKYPYEPELPNISGCGGELQYWELDIGTTGTVTPGYQGKLYNNGSSITRGAARVVYARQDLNRNGIYEQNEVYVFYTHNHYNDFREYLNYYGGWGEMFGNVTGGGVFDSKTQCNPTPYVPTAYRSFSQRIAWISYETIKPVAIAAGFCCFRISLQDVIL